MCICVYVSSFCSITYSYINIAHTSTYPFQPPFPLFDILCDTPFLHSFLSFSHFSNILWQRFGIAYLVAGVTILYVPTTNALANNDFAQRCDDVWQYVTMYSWVLVHMGPFFFFFGRFLKIHFFSGGLRTYAHICTNGWSLWRLCVCGLFWHFRLTYPVWSDVCVCVSMCGCICVCECADLCRFLCVCFHICCLGCGRGYLGPGGIGDYGNYQNCTGRWIMRDTMWHMTFGSHYEFRRRCGVYWPSHFWRKLDLSGVFMRCVVCDMYLNVSFESILLMTSSCDTWTLVVDLNVDVTDAYVSAGVSHRAVWSRGITRKFDIHFFGVHWRTMRCVK